ncbi:MAG: hypothetical protein H6669_07425 [Ardenticatenaceae bacterium]|nr:hypothetical protein [Ardenticatenaceae bacterium]
MAVSQVIYKIAAVLSWGTFLWIIYRARETNETTLQTWGFVAFFGGAVTVQIEPIYTTTGRIFGVNNLAWLLSYCLGAAATYLTINALHGGLKIKEEPVIMRRILYGTLLVLLLIFPAIARLPNTPDHTNPTTVAEIVFMLVLYLYGASACLSIAHTFFKLQQQDSILYSRLRWMIIVAAGIFGSGFFIARIPYVIIVFLHPALALHPAVAAIQLLSRISFFSCLVWVFFFLPTPVFQRLARPVETADKLLALRELNVVQKRVAALCPPVAPVILNQSWRERLQNLDFHLFRAVIAILDGKKVLADHFANGNEAMVPSPIPGTASRSAQLTRHNEQARRLYQTLDTVPDNTGYRDLVSAYRQVGRLYRKGVYG